MNKSQIDPAFSMCCLHGKVKIPTITAPPKKLQRLFKGDSAISKRFLSQSRIMNNVFAFSSFGTSIKNGDVRHIPGRGPPTFQARGQLYHKIGSLLPPHGQQRQFAQLYIHDSSPGLTEANARLDFIHKEPIPTGRSGSAMMRARRLDWKIIRIIQNVMDRHNPYAQMFKTAAQRIRDDGSKVLGMKLICSRSSASGNRRYNLPAADEVAAILPGDGVGAPEDRDIWVQLFNDRLLQVSSLHPAYFPLTYPLLFPHGEDGFHLGLTRYHHPQHQVQQLPQPIRFQHQPVNEYDSESTDTDSETTDTEAEGEIGPETGYRNNSFDHDLDLEHDMDLAQSSHSQEDCNATRDPDLETHLLLDPSATDDEAHEYGDYVHNDAESDSDTDDNLPLPNLQRGYTKRLTMMDYFSYRLQLRHGDNSRFLFRSKRLLQQLMVDMFCTMDMNRLNYIKDNQKKLRVELYPGIYTVVVTW